LGHVTLLTADDDEHHIFCGSFERRTVSEGVGLEDQLCANAISSGSSSATSSMKEMTG
jgi:hypothetical protein